MDTCIFVVLPFCGRELVRNFRGKDGTKSFRIFKKPSAINRFGMPLLTTFELGYPSYSPQHYELLKTYVGLKSQHFPLSLAFIGIEF